MANTVIAIRASGTAAATPSLGVLANGEIALNYADGIIYYKTSSNTLGSIRTTQPAGLTTEVQFNDAGSFGSNANFTFNKTTGTVNVSNALVVSGISLLPRINSAFDVANSKAYIFEQNTTPATANSADLWVHSDTGVMYQNFGNTTSPVWAEVGPTGTVANTAPGIVSASQINVSYTPATTVNTAVQITAANTKGGTGYGDVLLITNSSTGATNPNKYFRLNSTGTLEIINSAYSAAIFTITDGGSLAVAGSITPTTWTAGQVIKDTMLSNSEITVSATTVATSTSDTDFISYSYTPVSASSYLIIHVHVASYDAAKTAGSGQDSYFSRIKVDGNEIVYGSQYTRDTYTFRTGVLFPLTGRYTNSSTAAKSITVGVRRDSADDSITITNSQTALWMRITEVAR